MNQRRKDIIGRFVILFLSAGLYFWNQHSIFNEGKYYLQAMRFDALGLIICGGYRTERINKRENIDQLNGLKLLTPKWRGILISSLIFAGADWIYVEWFFQS